jgi:hypothetical protein
MEKRYFTLAAATALVMGAGLLWPVAGQAGSYYGPLVKGNGQCWHSSYGVGAAGMGYWGDCARDAPSLWRGERSIHSDTQKGKAPYPNAAKRASAGY